MGKPTDPRTNHPESPPTQKENSVPGQADGKQSQDFQVVGIGASAGGLEAFEQFFSGMPADTGLAFIIIQHLSPPHKSILSEIIQRFTTMRVAQVTDGIQIQPNHVYVIPPGTDLAMRDGHLILLDPQEARPHRLPIDFFFRSLAHDQHERAIGVVLSGTGSDGSLGVKSIKAEGGMTLAQAPDTATFRDMPRNAIETYDIDFVLPPVKMGEMILKVIHHEVVTDYQEETTTLSIPFRGFQKLFSLLHARTGHDFSLYKQNTLVRRIERRMKINLVKNLDEYISYLEHHPEEIDSLFHELLINFTSFFRDTEAFQALTEQVLRPGLEKSCGNKTPFRVWIAGCSTGEEAYSIAIAIQEHLDVLQMDCQVQIFATDVNEDAILIARAGAYPESIHQDVSEERLQRFFIHTEQGYQIKKHIRDRLVFAVQNMTSDPPYSRIDLLSCRNVLIYMDSELQNQLFPIFHQALAPEGALFLGNSESIGGFHTLFTNIDRKHKLFRRREGITPVRIPQRKKYLMRELEPQAAIVGLPSRKTSTSQLQVWVEKALLEYYTPACAVIDDRHSVLFIHGHTGKFLEPAAGENNANILQMAREGLKTELATAIHTAAAYKETVKKEGVRVKTNGAYQLITLTVQPVENGAELQGFLLVVFEEEPSPTEVPESIMGSQPENSQVRTLKKQLKEKDDYLRTIIEELEDANQDLKSANEELQSTNEEMQSANEEMETSKEELQSSNEELITINNEMQKKNEELAGINNDMYNLLASTEIGTLFLDLDLKLRRYTPAVNRVYNFLPSDIGRPVDHIVSRLNYDRFLDDTRQVLDSLTPKAVEVQTKDGAWFLVNIKPYRTLENAIDGVVVTFVDVTAQKRGDELRRMGTILRDSNDAVTVLDFSGHILAWNRGAVSMYGWEEAEAKKMTYFDMVPEDLREEAAAFFKKLSRGELVRSYETQRLTHDGRRLDVWMTLTALIDDSHKPVGIATTERDITERNRAMQRLAMSNRMLKALASWYRRLAETKGNRRLLAAEACRILVEQAGYRLAWIEKMDQKTKIVRPIRRVRMEGVRPDPGLDFRKIERATRDVVKRVVENGEAALPRNIHLGGRAEDGGSGQEGVYAVLPLVLEHNILGALVILAAESNAFEPQEFGLLGTFAESLAAALGPLWNLPEPPD